MDKQTGLLKELLEKLLEPNIRINTCAIERLLDRLDKKNTTVTHHTKIYSKWIQTALNTWNGERPIEVAAFLVNLCSVMCKNEVKLLLLLKMNILDQAIHVLGLNRPGLDHRLKVPYLKLLRSCMKTKLGLDWVITTHQHWCHMYVIPDMITYEPIRTELPRFIVEMFYKVVEVNRLFIVNIIQTMLDPMIRMSDSVTSNNLNEMYEQLWYENLISLLTFIKDMFEVFIWKITDQLYYKLFMKYNQLYNMEERMLKILKAVKSKQFTLDCSRILLPMYYFNISILTSHKETVPFETIQGEIDKILHVFNVNFDRGYVDNVLDLWFTECIYRNNMRLPVTYVTHNKVREPFSFEIQFLIIPLIPLLSWNTLILGKNLGKTLMEDAFREEFVEQLLTRTHQMIVNTIYHWRNKLITNGNLLEEAILSLEYILKSMHLFSQNCAIQVFKTLVYILGDYVTDLIKKEQSGNIRQHYCLSLLLDNLITCIEKFDLTWKDSIETIDVMNISTESMKLPNLAPELVAKCLKLLNLSITKYMSPNLALLIETSDSNLHRIGKILSMKLRDPDLNVRRAGFEVLFTLSDHANTKFPYFLKIILEFGLHIMALNAAVGNDFVEVRKQALLCLQRMVIIRDISCHSMDVSKLQENLLIILKDNQQQEVHKQALDLARVLVEQDHFPEAIHDDLYEIMSDFGLQQSNVELRAAALDICLSIMRWLLRQEGYVDSEFPQAIFLKKKIVVLDSEQIKQRVTKSMYKFSKIGCFGVILSCRRDKHPILVEKSSYIISRIFNLFQKYKISPDLFEDSPEMDNLQLMITDCLNNIQTNGVNLDLIEMLNNTVSQNSANVPQKVINPRDFLRALAELKVENPNDQENANELENFLSDILDSLTKMEL